MKSRNNWPLDKVCSIADVTKKTKMSLTTQQEKEPISVYLPCKVRNKLKLLDLLVQGLY